MTNTDKISIPLEEIFDGGPEKDGIPSIDDPVFLSQDDPRNDYLLETSQGAFVQIAGEKRWYPYNILNWHEIVNDQIGDVYFSVTFCPLCGSAVVFDRTLPTGVTTFGVSGKLYQSNMLMYDRQTESLWSQISGEAVVGERLGHRLEMLDVDLMTWADLQMYHPDAQVLSTDTGALRNYDLESPYGAYDTNESLYFPVANLPDSTLPLKEMLYVANLPDGNSISFVLSDLRKNRVATLDVGGKQYVATYEMGEYMIKQGDDLVLPGFFEMWFSWASRQDGELYLWRG